MEGGRAKDARDAVDTLPDSTRRSNHHFPTGGSVPITLQIDRRIVAVVHIRTKSPHRLGAVSELLMCPFAHHDDRRSPSAFCDKFLSSVMSHLLHHRHRVSSACQRAKTMPNAKECDRHSDELTSGPLRLGLVNTHPVLALFPLLSFRSPVNVPTGIPPFTFQSRVFLTGLARPEY